MRSGWIRFLALLAACGLAGAAMAQAPTSPAAPAASAATTAAEPKPDDTNAQRAKTQPGNNAPFWRAVRESGSATHGVTNLPGIENGTLVQPFVQYPGSSLTTAGEAWRQVRNQWILPYGGSLLLITVLAGGIFYWRKGPLGGHHEDSGRRIERFTPMERAAHWSNATAFVLLAVSGLVMAFGKFFLLPILGGTLFGWLSYALKTLHNFVGPLFAVSLVIVLITFVKDNFATAADWVWLRKGGGMLGGDGHEIPSHRFNAGEKGVYWWGAFFPGLLIVISGLVLNKLLPGLDYLRTDMQLAHMVHAIAAIFMMVVLLGHIYMGTLGVKGALGAMKTGWVDEGWAREHHELWYNDVKAGKIPAQRSGTTPPGGPAATVARA
jgi:formate dehydrogenase subunit gamma